MKFQNKKKRTGAATVEFALVVPILFLLVFGAYELGRANLVMHTTEAAAYEGARIGIVPGTQIAEVERAAQFVLSSAGIRNATIQVTPSNLSTESDTITVTITVSYAENTIMSPLFMSATPFVRSCELTREET